MQTRTTNRLHLTNWLESLLAIVVTVGIYAGIGLLMGATWLAFVLGASVIVGGLRFAPRAAPVPVVPPSRAADPWQHAHRRSTAERSISRAA